MSEIVQNVLHKTHNATDKSHAAKPSIQTANRSIDNEMMINGITGYEKDLHHRLEKLEREAEIQSQQIELSECLEFVAQLVSMFKHTVITSELQNQNHWHHDTQNHLQKNKGVTGNRLLDDKVESIVISKGLTKEQWICLLYMALNTGDTVEINKISKKHLHKIHDMAVRLLEGDEQNAVFSLINATEKYMAQKYFTEK